MNLVDQLLKSDAKKADELLEGIFKSKRLARILGKEEPVDVIIREIPSRRLNDLISYQFNRKGNMDYSKTFDAKLMSCIEGVVQPDLTNKELQEHFGCSTAKDLCERLFGSEVNDISDEIAKLSGVGEGGDDDDEEEIKN